MDPERRPSKDIEKLKRALDLPKIDPLKSPSAIYHVRENNRIRVPDPLRQTKSNLRDTIKQQIKTEPTDLNNKTLFYFKHQDPSKQKQMTLHSFTEDSRKNLDYDTWKSGELQKIHESRISKNISNWVFKNDRKSRKVVSLDPKKTMKSSLTNVNFNKLNEIQIETLPKTDISEEKLKANLKEFIGIDKYPIDYKIITFDAPKTNFVRFEPLKSHMDSFKQNFEKRTTFEEQLLEKFHKSQANFNKPSTMPRRDMIGLAQWLDKTSQQIFELDTLSPEEQLSNIQKIYTQCVSEVVEIISKECQERGSLLGNIWNIHIDLVNATLSRLEIEKNSQYANFLSEVEKIRNSYATTFDALMKENKDKTTMLEDRDYLIKKLNHDNISLKRKEARSNKTIQSLGDAINELKDMFDSVLAENIKLKLSKEEETNLRKGERELLKQQFDELLKSKNKAKQGIFQRVEKIIKTQALTHSPTKDLLGNQKSFTFELELFDAGKDSNSFGTLKDIVLKDIKEENEDPHADDLDGMTELFTREIGVDTKDLLPVNNKETTTRDLARYFSKEESAQTVYFDEINDENEAADIMIEKPLGTPLLPSANRMRASFINTGDVVLEQMLESKKDFKGSPFEKQIMIRKRMFSFSAESLQHLDKFKEIQSYTLTGICEWYSSEMQNFFNFLRQVTENVENENFLELVTQFDWIGLVEMFRNVSMIHEQFIKNIKNRDTTRSKEILQHKIELLERKIEMDDAEKMRNLFRNNYNKLREKFEEFYKMTIRIQIQSEDMENASPNLPNNPELRPKRRKSLNMINQEQKKEFLDSIQEEWKHRKKGKTMLKSKANDAKPRFHAKEDKSEPENISPIINSTRKTPSKKFEDIPEKVSDMKKITHFSVKKPPEETKEREEGTSNSIHSFESKQPPSLQVPTLQVGQAKGIGEAQSYNDFKVLEDDNASKNVNINNNPYMKSAILPQKLIKNHSIKMLQSTFIPVTRNTETDMHTSSFDVKGTLEMIDREKKEVMKMEEKHLKDQREFRDMIANEQMINLINQANNVLPQKKSWDKISSLNADKCYAFLHRIEVSEIGTTKEVTLSTVLKTISQLFTELIKLKYNKKGNLNPLFFILYEFLMQRYGNIRERAEGKMIKIFQGCKTHLELPRVRCFARLLGLVPDKKNPLLSIYDGNDLDFYLHYFMQLDDHPMSNIPGIMLAMSPQEGAFTALAKALEVLTRFCSNYGGIISKIRQENIVNQIKAVKLDDPIVSRKYVVDVDFVIEKLFELRDEVFKIYKMPFLAVDIDYNEALNINEFMLLVRNIERNRYSEKEIVELFTNEYDFYDEEKEEKCMSFKRFAFVCERERIIGLRKQDSLMHDVTDEVKTLKQLKDEWDVKKNLIKLKLIKTNYYNSFYLTVIKVIEAYLNSKVANEEEGKVNWFRYRIMDEESNCFLLQFETESCLPKELNLISMKASSLELTY